MSGYSNSSYSVSGQKHLMEMEAEVSKPIKWVDAREYEEELAKITGGKTHPGSGNQWHAKMDSSDEKFIWSNKSTEKGSFRLTESDLEEVIQSVEGPGGYGGDKMPAMAIKIRDKRLVVLRQEDFVRICKEDPYIVPTRAEMKNAKARTTILDREE